MEAEIAKTFLDKLVVVVRNDAGQIFAAKGILKRVTEKTLLLDRFGNALAVDLDTVESIREINQRGNGESQP